MDQNIMNAYSHEGLPQGNFSMGFKKPAKLPGHLPRVSQETPICDPYFQGLDVSYSLNMMNGERLRTPFDKALRASQQRQDSKALQSGGDVQPSSTVSGAFYSKPRLPDPFQDQYNKSRSIGFGEIDGQLNRKEAIQHRIIKLKSLQPIKSIPDEGNLSLADTLRQNRVLREHIEKERAQSRIMKEPDQQQLMRIRPATPKLNLLKMRKQPMAPLAAHDGQGAPVSLQRKRKPQLPLLQPLAKLPQLPLADAQIPDQTMQTVIIRKRKKKRVQQAEKEPQPVCEEQQLDELMVDIGLKQAIPKRVYDKQTPPPRREDDDFERGDQEYDYDEEDDVHFSSQVINGGLLSNFQEKFEKILENEEVEDAIELNEKFLADHLGVKCEDLSRLMKIELRVDTSCHNLQVTGEILSSLEYLRMSDSIIKSFRDIGTSFRFVRVLHLARCELNEVQGIQAFLNLEELYISHNMIEELFDIGFLENLTILDIEGNNIKEAEQLYYLSRCKQLQNLNISHNPVCQSESFYPLVQQNTPSLLVFNDELVLGSRFYDNKVEQAKRKVVTEIDLKDIVGVGSLLQLGVPLKYIEVLTKDSLSAIAKDDQEEVILRYALQNLSLETKAARQFQEHDEFTDNLGQTIRCQTPQRTQQFIKMKDGTQRAVTPMMFKTATTSFYKTSTRKSTSMSKEQNDENDGSVGNQSEEKKKENSKLAVLRSRHSKLEDPGTERGFMPQDIKGLIKQVDIHAGQDAIRDKLQQHSAISFYSTGQKQPLSIPTQEGKTYQSQTTLQNPAAEEPDIEQRFNLDASGIHLSAKKRSHQDSLRNSLGSSGVSFSGKGPIRAERIVLKSSDIQFSKSFKVAKE